jgi:hypothetical protein
VDYNGECQSSTVAFFKLEPSCKLSRLLSIWYVRCLITVCKENKPASSRASQGFVYSAIKRVSVDLMCSLRIKDEQAPPHFYIVVVLRQ